MEHLNMKQAQSPLPKTCSLHSPLCSVPALCNVPSHRLWPSFLLGANWGDRAGQAEAQSSDQHTSKLHPWHFQPAASGDSSKDGPGQLHNIFERERSTSLWLSLWLCPLGYLWYQVLGFSSWAIDEDKDPWKELSYEWENCFLHLPLSFQFYQLFLVWMSDFLICSLSDYSSTLFWRPVSHLQPSIILSLSALNSISNWTIAVT